MRIVFLENEDSFSWNIVDRLPFEREEIAIVPGSKEPNVAKVLINADALVVGPGPKDPLRANLVPWIRQAARIELPVLGICLGHQALGLAFGATLSRVNPRHGKISPVRFESSRLFAGVEGRLRVMRYHSLALSAVTLPLRVIAVSEDDNTVMAIEHESLPMAGVQFHPDSFATPGGEEILIAFFRSTTLGSRVHRMKFEETRNLPDKKSDSQYVEQPRNNLPPIPRCKEPNEW